MAWKLKPEMNNVAEEGVHPRKRNSGRGVNGR